MDRAEYLRTLEVADPAGVCLCYYCRGTGEVDGEWDALPCPVCLETGCLLGEPEDDGDPGPSPAESTADLLTEAEWDEHAADFSAFIRAPLCCAFCWRLDVAGICQRCHERRMDERERGAYFRTGCDPEGGGL